MRYCHTQLVLAVCFLFLGPSEPVPAQELLRISEFMAMNRNGLEDEDRDEEDWIEIYNGGTVAVGLEGWYLTDKADNLTKWKFPAVTLAPNTYLVVFASDKDRRDPTGELHTNFKLSGAGEYLGLVQPDGVTVVSEFAPTYPPQAPNISYGLSESTSEKVLLAPGAPAKALVPEDEMLEAEPLPDAPRPWTLEDLDDSDWLSGTTGVGYGFRGSIGLDVFHMRNANETLYVRVPFVVDDPSAIRTLTLRVRFSDGVIAYINGQEVARDNAPAPGDETWNSGAPEDRLDSIARYPVDFVIPRFDFLHVGTNLLAVQGLNHHVSVSSLLIVPELLAGLPTGAAPQERYFPMPTPGYANNAGVEMVGPVISGEDHQPRVPSEREDLLITARILPTFGAVASAQLHYRMMFGNEVMVPLLDDGNNGDGASMDGVYGARIPARSLDAGQMVRWYITATDTVGREARLPAFLDPLNSPEYCGTVVADPRLSNPLPVVHWFVQNPGAAGTDAGTRCALFYDGEFYDNVLFNIHGQSSRGFPKKSYDVDFHPGHNFQWAPGQPKADDINMLTTYPDKAHMRNILAYETYRDADCPYHWVIPVRVQQNGAFWGTAHLVENGDEDWLIRMGLNVEGALYKMYNRFTSPSHATSGAEKKTRKNESNADLSALYEGISRSGEARRRFLYDNVDVAQVVNFLAARVLTGDVDCCHKNYYLYRDTGRSDEWQMWPWDVDLSFGRRWTSSLTYWDQNLITNTGLFVGSNNRLPQAIFGTAETRQMYLRRIRTLMDELLKPLGTPQEDLYYEWRIDELAASIGPDAALDAAKWNSHAWGNGSGTSLCCPQPFPEAVAELRDVYLPRRREQLFYRLAPRAGEIPNAQPADAVIIFGDVESNPAAGNQDEEYIQLLNPNWFFVDISGWTLSAGISDTAPIFTFRGGTVIPANGVLYVAADRPAFRARDSFPTGGQALFVVGDYARRLSARGETLELANRQGVVVASVSTRSSPSLTQSFLRITEIMYHPPTMSGDTFDNDEYEYVELKNIGTVGISLLGVHFAEGITFDFASESRISLAAGQRVLLVKNRVAFAERYGAGFNVAGEYAGYLENGGERIRLDDARNETILDFEYDDSWYPGTDGDGFSLVIVDETARYDTWGEPTGWRPSTTTGGSPGTDD